MVRTTRNLRQPSPQRRYKFLLPISLELFVSCVAFLLPPAGGQDNVFIGTNQGAATIRIAVADFKPLGADPQSAALRQIFDTTLFADLTTAGPFDVVSKSLMPPGTPGAPSEVQLANYATAPANASFVVFGSLGVSNGKLVTNGFVFDTKNLQYPQVLAKQYSEDPTEDAARQTAHRFADEIILRLGGGTPGIAESKIYYVRILGKDAKEIWMMDYDGADQHAITHLGTISMGPRVSPDNSRIAFESLGKYGFQLKMYSLLLNRYLNFPTGATSAESPTWSPDGNQLAYAAAPSGDFQIWRADANGALASRITSFPGGNVQPTYNPKTGAQIGFISGRTGLPQLYIMNTDGSSVQRLTDGGYASSPSWSPSGQFITFAWQRKYGLGAPGGRDIYVIQVAPNADGSYKIVQLTHDGGPCDSPSWSPDGRHIVYANSADGKADHTRIWTMLADGTQQHPLTGPGADMPNWSWK